MNHDIKKKGSYGVLLLLTSYKINMNYQQLSIKICDKNDLDSVLKLQNIIFEELDNSLILCRNTEQISSQYLDEPNITIGVYDQDNLIGLIILVEPSSGETDLREKLKYHNMDNVAVFKLIMIKKEYRGYGLQHSLMWILEKIAYIKCYKFLCVSISSDDEYSKRNIVSFGYEFDYQEYLYDGLNRQIYVKKLKVNNYNTEIIKFVSECEGKKELLLNPDLSNCFKGTIAVATTGDVLEYSEQSTDKSYYGLYIKKLTPFVLLYDMKIEKWSIFEFSYNINSLILKNVWVNSVAKILFTN